MDIKCYLVVIQKFSGELLSNVYSLRLFPPNFVLPPS